MLAAPFLALLATLAAPPDDDLPVVVLIGDSIRMGYAPFVAERLAGKARVVSPEENGGDSANVLEHLGEWAIARKPAVVHFNAGLHDIKRDPKTGDPQVPLDAYRNNLKAILGRLDRETSARLIFATTTPVLDERHNANKPFHRREADVEAYNAAALELMKASPIVTIDDLHAAAQKLGLERALTADGVHFTEEASRALAARVAQQIESALEAPNAALAVDCPRPKEAPRIDGFLQEPLWHTQAVRIETFPVYWAGEPSDLRTVAWLAWDDEALYYAAAMADDDLFVAGEKRNDKLWLGDVFELFFRPHEDRPEYYEFQINPRGVILELAFPKRGHPFDELAALPPLGMQAAAQVRTEIDAQGDDDNRWTVEGKIPWSVFAPSGGRPKEGDTWRFALHRYDYGPGGKDPVLMSTAPLRRPNFHLYEDYGRLRFVGPRP